MIHVRSPQPLEGQKIKPDMGCPTLCICLSGPNKTETPQIGMNFHSCEDYIRHHCWEKWMLCIQHRTQDHQELYHSPTRLILVDLNMHSYAEIFIQLLRSLNHSRELNNRDFSTRASKASLGVLKDLLLVVISYQNCKWSYMGGWGRIWNRDILMFLPRDSIYNNAGYHKKKKKTCLLELQFYSFMESQKVVCDTWVTSRKRGSQGFPTSLLHKEKEREARQFTFLPFSA